VQAKRVVDEQGAELFCTWEVLTSKKGDGKEGELPDVQ